LRAQPPDAVSLATARLDGKLYWLATGPDGTVTRLDAAGIAAPLPESELAATAARIAGQNGIAAQGMMTEEDAYYFSHHDHERLPVYRVILSDDESTRYYLDPRSGALLLRADANGRWHRWLFEGLHRMDFAASLRARPVWDIVMIVLMLGGLAVGTTGVYLAIRRIRRDLAALFRIMTGFRQRPQRAIVVDAPPAP